MKRFALALALAGAAFMSPIAAHASPPSNDNFANAQPMATHVEVANMGEVDMTNATVEPDERMPSCGGGNRSIWFRLDNDVEHGHYVSVRSFSTRSATALWSGNSLTNLREVACNNYWKAGPWFAPADNLVSTWMTTGETLYVQVLTDAAGSASISAGPSPTDDDWRAPDVVTDTSAVYSNDLSTSTVQLPQPNPGCAVARHDNWHAFTAVASTTRMYAQMAPRQTGFAAVHAIDATGIHAVACVRANEPAITFPTTPGTVYLLELGTDIASPSTYTGVQAYLSPGG